MNGLTIDQLQGLVEDIEWLIQEEIETFEEETGCEVSSIELDRFSTTKVVRGRLLKPLNTIKLNIQL